MWPSVGVYAHVMCVCRVPLVFCFEAVMGRSGFRLAAAFMGRYVDHIHPIVFYWRLCSCGVHKGFRKWRLMKHDYTL